MKATQYRLDFISAAIPSGNPDHLGRMAIKDASDMEVRILGDDCQVMGQRILPYLRVFSFMQADTSDVS